MRAVYAETTDEVDALERGLEAVSGCPFRVVLLHYAPTSSTIEGEPPGIWAFLGSDRLGRPIAEHHPDLVLHGHGHAGTYEGFIGAVPVYNVSLPVMARDFAVFELGHGAARDVSVEPRPGETQRRKEVH
jgi:Icc-related predicted phosphoesterase